MQLPTTEIKFVVPFKGLLVVVEGTGAPKSPHFSILDVILGDKEEFLTFLEKDEEFCLEEAEEYRERFLIRGMVRNCLEERDNELMQ